MAKKRRSKVRKVITLLVTASLVAGGGYVGYQKYTETKAAEPSGQSDTESISAPVVKTAQATKGTIASTVVGSGTLSDGDSEDVTIPTGITIDQVLVESGDTVKKGDALATVDQTSLASEISSLTDSISSIDEELEDLEDEDDDETVTTVVSGRVKDLQIASGDDAATIMEKNGSLLTISVDGLMAVDLENASGISKGDTVKVMLSDGTEENGTVASVTGTTATVTISDDGPTVGDEVTVTTADGTKVGTGTLYVHQPLAVTETDGTVGTVYVSENEEVDAGDSLFTLTDITDSADKDKLLAERENLTDELNTLLKLKETGEITATCDGTVDEVNVSDGTHDGDDCFEDFLFFNVRQHVRDGHEDIFFLRINGLKDNLVFHKQPESLHTRLFCGQRPEGFSPFLLRQPFGRLHASRLPSRLGYSGVSIRRNHGYFGKCSRHRGRGGRGCDDSHDGHHSSGRGYDDGHCNSGYDDHNRHHGDNGYHDHSGYRHDERYDRSRSE